MKTLYILIKDGGDGSYYPQYTFDKGLINKLHQAYNDGFMDYENGIGVDGDGFHYSEMYLPDGCTEQSLWINVLPDDYADKFFTDSE